MISPMCVKWLKKLAWCNDKKDLFVTVYIWNRNIIYASSSSEMRKFIYEPLRNSGFDIEENDLTRSVLDANHTLSKAPASSSVQ